MGCSQQVGLHRRQHGRAFPFEDSRDYCRRFARPRRSDERKRSPVTTPRRLRPDAPCRREPLSWWRLRGHETAPELSDDEPPRNRPSHEQGLKLPPSREPRTSINAERPALRGANLRPPDPMPGCAENPADASARDPCAQPVEKRTRQTAVMRCRPGRGRTPKARRESRQGIGRGGERQALGSSSEQKRQDRTRPHRRDDRHRDASEDHHRQLEPTEPIAFHTPVGRNRARKPRSKGQSTPSGPELVGYAAGHGDGVRRLRVCGGAGRDRQAMRWLPGLLLPGAVTRRRIQRFLGRVAARSGGSTGLGNLEQHLRGTWSLTACS